MRVTTTIIIFLICFALAGLINIALLFAEYQLQNINQHLIATLYSEHPFQFYFALISIVILIALPVWLSRNRSPRKIYQRFHDIDSNTLDTNPQLSQEFYKMALFYRARYGHKRYQHHIVKHFDFFYDYHNYALNWIDEVISRTNSRIIPEHFILSTIASGHIGRVYYHAHYASGLPACYLKANVPLLFHDCAEDINIWSYNSRHPHCKMKKDTVKLHSGHHHPSYISAILTGVNPEERDKAQLELHFPAQSTNKGKQKRGKTGAKQNLLEFQRWLKQVSRTKSRFPGDTSIDVAEIASQDSIFTTPLVRHLEQLVYRKIDAFYPRSRLPFADSSIALDALVLCNKIGVIAITEKLEQGEITYSGDPIWHRFRDGKAFELQNPCIQANLAKSSLSNLLSIHDLARWPITSLVVYSKDNVELNMAIGTKRIQCHVLKLVELEKWLDHQLINPEIHFTQEDISLFNSIMRQKQRLSNVV